MNIRSLFCLHYPFNHIEITQLLHGRVDVPLFTERNIPLWTRETQTMPIHPDDLENNDDKSKSRNVDYNMARMHAVCYTC